MIDSIKDKLRVLLNGPVNTEPKALYLMAQLRKLNERENRLTSPLTLWMHWALHTKLHAPDATFHLLQDIDNCVHALCEGILIPTPETLSFSDFRKNLCLRLKSHELPTTICDDSTRWSKFMAAYSSIIEDCDLTLNMPHAGDLKYVTQATFRKGQKLPMGDFPFTINWQVFLKNCKFKEINVGPRPNENKHGFTGWSFTTTNA